MVLMLVKEREREIVGNQSSENLFGRRRWMVYSTCDFCINSDEYRSLYNTLMQDMIKTNIWYMNGFCG